jgi:hypothetical protein
MSGLNGLDNECLSSLLWLFNRPRRNPAMTFANHPRKKSTIHALHHSTSHRTTPQ